MRNLLCCTAALLAATALSCGARADTTDVTWQNRVTVAKQGAHCADDPHCFNRYHPAIPAVARAKPGDFIVFETRDALDSDLTLDSVADDVTAVDLNLVHPMTGPVHIEGAAAGDALAVTLVDIEPDQYGYTVIVPGFGFLRDLYTEPYLVNWKLDRQAATSDQMPGVRIPIAAFMGSVGVLPGDTEVKTWLEREQQLAEAGGAALPPQPIGALPAAVCGPDGSHPDQCLRTIPPRENGGNMDVQQMQIGTHAAAALLHRRLRPVRRRRPLRAGRRRGLGHRDRDGRRGHGPHRGAEGPGQRRSPRRTSRAARSSRRSRPSGSTPPSAFR